VERRGKTEEVLSVERGHTLKVLTARRSCRASPIERISTWKPYTIEESPRVGQVSNDERKTGQCEKLPVLDERRRKKRKHCRALTRREKRVLAPRGGKNKVVVFP